MIKNTKNHGVCLLTLLFFISSINGCSIKNTVERKILPQNAAVQEDLQQKESAEEQTHKIRYKTYYLNRFVEVMLQKHQGKTLCPSPSSSIDSISSSILKELGNDAYRKDPKVIATTIWTLYPCPFSPFRPELKPASQKDIEGVWLFPESSQKLRFAPESNQKSPLDPLPVKCDAIGFYPGGELRTALMGGKDKCPFEKSSDLDLARTGPRVSSWSLIGEGRISITRTDLKNYIVEWDIYTVLSPFSFNDVQFKKGDLLGFLRKENGNTVNAATQFRHLTRLP